ncbi:hypothetical protein KL86DYS1_10881 [uncultured Dysgonomonas sp.]|uniref:Uncharacterized protein n=1 Tax=uncultured Dysgonomonas sp. TaxID=206096 RepID=A0A212J215_9BACT|nr:hypothetical protein KL86DYS1_10881 [uncultured Dysgonomonas sp.]
MAILVTIINKAWIVLIFILLGIRIDKFKIFKISFSNSTVK